MDRPAKPCLAGPVRRTAAARGPHDARPLPDRVGARRVGVHQCAPAVAHGSGVDLLGLHLGRSLLSPPARREGPEMSIDRVEGLRQAVAAAPDNHVLRLLLAEALVNAGNPADALSEYERLLAAGQLDEGGLVAGGRAALAAGRHDR